MSEPIEITDAMVEAGARKLCLHLGKDPDEDITPDLGPDAPRWKWGGYARITRSVLKASLAAGGIAEKQKARGGE